MSIEVLITRLKTTSEKAVEYEQYIQNYHSMVISKIKELTGKDVFLLESEGKKYFQIDNKKYNYMDIVLLVEEWKRKGELLQKQTQQLLQAHQVDVSFIPDSGVLEVKKSNEVLFQINLKTKKIEDMFFNSTTIAITPMFPRMLLLIQNF